jgi:ATP/maltotriose-dependent transcriptional regulator MalT
MGDRKGVLVVRSFIVVKMTVLSMREREDTDGFIRVFSGANGCILDYLLADVPARLLRPSASF